MNSYLFNRSLGSVSPQAFQQAETTRLLHTLQPAPNVQYDSSNERKQDRRGRADEAEEPKIWAHPAGINCLEIDRFEGR